MGIRRRRSALPERHNDAAMATWVVFWLPNLDPCRERGFCCCASKADPPAAIDILGSARARFSHAGSPPPRRSGAELAGSKDGPGQRYTPRHHTYQGGQHGLSAAVRQFPACDALLVATPTGQPRALPDPALL